MKKLSKGRGKSSKNALTTVGHKSDILIYQTEDQETKIEVRLEDETVWLTQSQMAELFQTTKQNVSLHIKNVFEEGELTEDSVVKEYLTTATDEKSYKTKLYNLDVIISVGYRVKSHRGTQFRIWATQHLKEYIIKGYVLDDDRFKHGDSRYFEELLERIRDIRSSERTFYRKVLDIYATSIDYDPRSDAAKRFLAIAQNKLHWAVVGKTAAEIVAERVSAKKKNLGLKTFRGATPRKDEITIAKNYLSENELSILNRLVSQYLDFAELQALRRKPMPMHEWESKLNSFLNVNDMEILQHAGKISHEIAEELAHKEFEKYKKLLTVEEDDPIHPDLKASLGADLEHNLKALEVTVQKKRKGKSES